MDKPASQPGSTFWSRHYHGPKGPLSTDNERRRAGLLHAFTFVGLFTLTFFGIKLVASGNFQTALMDGSMGVLLGLNLLFMRWSRRPRLAAAIGLILLAVYLLLHVITGGDQGTGFLWSILFPPAAAFLLGSRWGLAFQLGFVAALVVLMAGTDVLVHTGMPDDFATKVAGLLVLISVFSFFFENARERAQRVSESARKLAVDSASAMSQFLANVSHEVRTPLNAIIGLGGVLSRMELTGEQRKYLKLSQTAARQLLALMEHILDLSKAEAGKLEINAGPASLRNLLEQIVAVHKPKAEEKGLRLELDLDGEIPESIDMDAIRLGQVIGNLVANALKFTESGAVRVRASVRSDEEPKRVVLRIQIEDTGSGVEPAQSERIFDQFVQADGSRARHHEGAGLGLNISRKLIGLMGGAIGYQPHPEGGSIFWLEVPALIVEAPAEVSAEIGAPKSYPAFVTAKVLLVEDDPVNATVARALLAELGLEATLAENGLKALEMFSEASFDIILMDIQLPGLDGVATTRRIREQEKDGQRVPIVAVTAHATHDDRAHCLDAGMDAYLTKPLELSDLAQTLKRWLKLSQSADQDTPVFDWAHMQTTTRSDEKLQKQLTGLFFEHTPKLLSALDENLDIEDDKSMADVAHKLKGSCGTLGAFAMAAAARKLEEAARRGDRSVFASLVENVHQEFERLEKEIGPG